MDSGADERAGTAPGADAPVTPAMVADLQAGLLDNATAARLRHRARTDPAVARLVQALDRVRDDLAHLGADDSSAPEVPAAVTARIGAALQAAPPPSHPDIPGQHAVGFAHRQPAAHSVRRSVPRLRRLQLIGAVAGLCAAVVGVGLGTATLLQPPAPTRSAGLTADRITVAGPARDIPLSDPEVVGLLSRKPDYGALTDPQRRASCLSGLGYSAATRVLGARPVDMNGRPGVLMVLPGDTPNAFVTLVVGPNCSSADTGLLAETVVRRP